MEVLNGDNEVARIYLQKISEIDHFPSDIDKEFTDRLIEILPSGSSGLRIIENHIQEESAGKSILLAIYVEFIRHWLVDESCEPNIKAELDSGKAKEFLSNFTDAFFNENSILQNFAFKLIYEMEKFGISSLFDIGLIFQMSS
jgi:hypothetical protein